MDLEKISLRVATGSLAAKLNAVKANVEWVKDVPVWHHTDLSVQSDLVKTWIAANPAGLTTAGYNVFVQSKDGSIAFFSHVDGEWYGA